MAVGDIEAKGLDCEVCGGGRMEHEPSKKSIKIYGYSQVRNVCLTKTAITQALDLSTWSQSVCKDT